MIDTDNINHKKTGAMMEFDRALVQLMVGEINVINEVLFQHNVHAGVLPADAHITPTFLTYRITLGPGVRVGRVTHLRHELTDALSRYRKQNISVRLTEAPLLLEVPHPDPKPIRYLDATYLLRPHCLLAGEAYSDQSTQQVVLDLQQTPHVLLAAATGEGKSLCMTVGLLSLCEHNGPDTLVVHLIDLKNDDLVALQGLPQVDTCAGTEEAALATLAKLDELKQARIAGADKSVRHVVCIDELAELVRNPTAMQRLESLLAMGRSLNINVIAATQHPLASVIGSLLKANFTARLVGRVLSNDASKVAAGMPKLGAEFLPGKGSFLLVEGGRMLRLQGYYLMPAEVAAVVQALRQRYGLADGANATGALLTAQLSQYQRLKRLGEQATAPYATDVLEYATRPAVLEVFARYYDRESGEMRYGWQASLVRTLFGSQANRGGWNRQKALDVVAYLQGQPPG
jgi:S-DNA-T family DNA segregation ATPase FtsK/SpoIIIE